MVSGMQLGRETIAEYTLVWNLSLCSFSHAYIITNISAADGDWILSFVYFCFDLLFYESIF